MSGRRYNKSRANNRTYSNRGYYSNSGQSANRFNTYVPKHDEDQREQQENKPRMGRAQPAPKPIRETSPDQNQRTPRRQPQPQPVSNPNESNQQRRFRPGNYVSIIPTNFNSYQVRELCDNLWSNKSYPVLKQLLNFFIILRKAIIQCNNKDKVEILDPQFPAMLESLKPILPDDITYSFYATEITPRPDGSKEYDEEAWCKMFIQMLPRCSHQFPITVELFKLIGEISQQITQSEMAVIRHVLIKDASGPMSKELDNLYDLQERFRWSDEKLEIEKHKVEAKFNDQIWKARKERTNEIYAMYDEMYDYVNESNVSNFNDPRITAYWRFITRNLCFPNTSFQHDTLSIPADQFSFVEVFNSSSTVYADNFAKIRSWYYSHYPNVDPINPNPQEFYDWFNICTFYNASELLADFSSAPTNIATIARFDDLLFKFYKGWMTTQFGQQCKEEERKTTIYNEIVDGVMTSTVVNRFLRSDLVYPYKSIRLFEESDDNEIRRMLNRLTVKNYDSIARIIKAYNNNVLAGIIRDRILDGQKSYIDVTCKLAVDLKLDIVGLLHELVEKLVSAPRQIDIKLNCLMSVILIQPDVINAYQYVMNAFETDKAKIEILRSLHDLTTIYPNETELIKPLVFKDIDDIKSRATSSIVKFACEFVKEGYGIYTVPINKNINNPYVK